MSTVRIRSSAPDPFNGLRGHDYIKVRGLTPQLGGMRNSQSTSECKCSRCESERLLPAILAICASRERRRIANLPQPNWNITSDEAVHELLDNSEFANV